MMRRILLTCAVLLQWLCCSCVDGPPADRLTLFDAGGAPRAIASPPAESAVVPAEPTLEAVRDVADGGPDGAVVKEGTARPRGTINVEPVLERPAFPPPVAGQAISIPGGTLLAGSAPADVLRVQYAENDLLPHQITPFEIDALPFPNDPQRPFLTGISRAEADEACRAEGKRLCTELEWEWACKSADSRRYPVGNRYDGEAYAEVDRLQPASPFGVFAMGRLLEWTSSAWGRDPSQVERGVARGFAPGMGVPAKRGRRCAMRWRQMPEASDPQLGFRCCAGKVNEASCFIERTRPPFSLYRNMKPDKFTQVIRSIPELYAIHDNPYMYSDGDVRSVLARRQTNREELAKQGIHFRWKPIRWIPRQGMELWVAVGRSNKHAFVVALHEVEDNTKYVHASSLVLWRQPLPLALVYQEGHRNGLYWAPCWGCRDGGEITFDDEKNEVIITHKW